MKLESYRELKEIVSELKQEVIDIENQMETDKKRIRDIDARLKVFRDAEPEDFKVFSPRNMEILHRDEIYVMKEEKSEYEKREIEFGRRKDSLTAYMKKIQNILKNQDKDALLEREPAETLQEKSMRELEELIHKIEQSSALIVQNPIQAKQDFACIGQCLKENVDRIRDTVWIV